MISAGLDCTVKLWDLRSFRGTDQSSSSSLSNSMAKPVAHHTTSKSINSAFFSPSGKTIVSTTMANSLDLYNDFHTANGRVASPTRKIRHDNNTGRWLSTFMAQWHPHQDLFVVGSMRKPRCIEVFDGKGQELAALQGDSLTAVASRCCFHPSSQYLTIVGGNSSGRVTVCKGTP